MVVPKPVVKTTMIMFSRTSKQSQKQGLEEQVKSDLAVEGLAFILGLLDMEFW